LEKQAALARIVYNDDTPVKIVEVMQLNKKDPSRERTGMFTTGIYAQLEEGRSIVLYYSGTRHAGENLSSVLKHRPQDLPPIIHMSDALSANLTEFLVYWAKCMTHARRKFIEIELFFPEECRFVIDQFASVYYADDQAKKAQLSGKKRLAYHQKHSKPAMQKLKRWMDRQVREKRVEPNSGLGKAIGYMQRHWQELTLFLRQPDAPLDTNVVEQALKIPIRLRKNSQIHRTCHGAYIASLLMSLIQTCRLCQVNPVDYLTVLQENKSALFRKPDDWLPWRYRKTLQGNPPSLKAA
jgi:transposase